MVVDAHSWLSPTARAIMELSSDSIFVLDAEYRITYINRTAEGLSIEDAIGTVIFDLLTKDQAKVARAAFKEATSTGGETSYEITFPLPDGRLSRWATRIGPQKDGTFVVVSSDVTERASAQEEFDLIFALSQDLLFVTGYDGKFQRVNPAAIETLGYSFEELTTMPFLEFVHPDDRTNTEEAFRPMVESGSTVRFFENRYRTKQGDYRLLQWTARPDPASRRTVGIARDITETRALEQKLHQSQKMEAVGQLAGGVAHDFNNLIQAILGAVDTAYVAAPNPEIVDQLKDIEMAAEGAADLVRGLLSFSRQLPSQTASVELTDLIEQTLKLLRRILPSTIDVRVEGRSVHRVVADRAQLEQALLNLCLNARDAMPSGGVLTVSVDDIEVLEGASPELYGIEPGHYVVLAVTDRGVGMPPEVRQRIFEPFFTTKPAGEGTGLGMAMVYGTVTRHGGHVLVDSELNQGTRVRILLPHSATESSLVSEGINAPEQLSKGHECILLAEDNPQIRRLYARALTKAGYQVLAAENGAVAIELARQHENIDLALLDVIMPEATGPQAYAAMRKQHPNLAVVFCSGYSDVSNFSHAVPEDAPMLTKPVRMRALLETVREVLDQRT